ncbi:hypothetical protein NUW58_g5029 [Xylaria curta]|uniref:Uncharacterized protein n=1 Tax=Xylaria curta TaxID=42375 RepID=A0ACC1P4X5_9PEZI|nr:hypothetical protein NUW58_g5029 [Xylaria curta]
MNTKTTGAAARAGDTTSPEMTRKAKMDALKKKAEEAKSRSTIESFDKLSLFDSTTASGWETIGTNSLMESVWSQEQMEAINKATSSFLTIMPVNDTRRSVMGPEQKYVGKDERGANT